MSKFNDYRGLFADQGDFDIPENYGVGLSYQLTPNVLLAGEYQRIRFSEVGSIANSVDSLFSRLLNYPSAERSPVFACA
ncbi:hypothetical protein [Aquitalea sp. LB_tupeE]|uniref:hypothetical protein n=1 Tax=Aquitalea sp. LB_tupeE TaxID=2748078 RepID=UPI0015B9BA4D|nr:hypothetical protein [Aquitalea sp. LB_tupeE]NWK76507.1 hypothetical protein [Aquitalea sp. LB_tupeE]